ncbi:hypothetical protein JD844_022173 [Phrynosoma platyrhinos]|uniref:Ig-like domain-containing protein n=1 Tax=Phrynosoma platyrhinos TaxID=52577 RepID=A0ABQ7SV03_PHRPL|nr:hypothetical protein JD844_022173 [Phrynosoma platyrhinos]
MAPSPQKSSEQETCGQMLLWFPISSSGSALLSLLSLSNPCSCLDVGSTSCFSPAAPAPLVQATQEIQSLPVSVQLLYQHETEMAAGFSQFCSSIFQSHSLLSLFVFWCALLVVSASAVAVTQDPLFDSFSQGKELTFTCSHSLSWNCDFYWYRQLPGKTELQHLGTLQYYTETWAEEFNHNPKNWLKGEWLGKEKKQMKLQVRHLQPDDTGLYLCAAKDTLLFQCQVYDMAAEPICSWYEDFKLSSLLYLSVIWFALPGSDSDVTVTQQPPVTSLLQEENLAISCSVSGPNYNFFWYRQLPGKIELQVLGILYSHDDKLADVDSSLNARLSGGWLDKTKKEMNLHLQSLQPGDTGLYLCAARDTVREAGTGAGTK